MKILLVAVNAKYIHSNLAIYDLKAYCNKYTEDIELAEYTINQYRADIVSDIYKKRPDLLAFSCYIWNIQLILEAIHDIHKVLPEVPIWLGGPEVSYDPETVLLKAGEITGILVGEGEQTFLELMEYYIEDKGTLEDIRGLIYRKENQAISANSPREVMDLNAVPFGYQDMSLLKHKIVYYESSRGCPFSCSYCLSSVDKRVRFRDVDTVKKELSYFLEQKVPQVKFVDRTFNCNRRHAWEIWSYIKEHDNGYTNFHFEVAADLMDAKELDMLSGMRPGLIQLEIGVQSVNPETITEIRRTMDFEKLKSVVRQIKSAENIHQHLDLIAGLPYEDFSSFRESFCEVYALHPEQLQLGFLKVLKGSHMHSESQKYGIMYSDAPPYEVLYTKWISYDEILRLKAVEEMVEKYYNSGQFNRILEYCIPMYANPFDFYDELAQYYEKAGWNLLSHSRMTRYEIIKQFLIQKVPEEEKKINELLTWDLYVRENLKGRPEWMKDLSAYKKKIYEFFKKEEQERIYLKGYEEYNHKQMNKMAHVEIFTHITGTEEVYLFDYRNRNPKNNEAAVFQITL